MKRSTVLGRLALILISCGSSALAIEVGDTPSFDATTTDGKPISLAKFKGKIVVVDFWATWCKPCMAEAQHMVAINQQYGPKGLQFVGISLDRDQAKLKTVAGEKGFTWPQIYDAGRSKKDRLQDTWGIEAIPSTFILDPTGKIVWMGHPAQIDKALEDAFDETPPIIVNPAVLAAAAGALDFVEQTIESDPLPAIQKMKDVTAEARKDPTVADRCTALGDKMTAAGEKLYADADALIEDKQYGAGVEKLKALAAALPKTPIAEKAQKRIDEVVAMPEAKAQADAATLDAHANELLKAAQAFQAQKKHEQAYAAFKSLLKQYPKSAAAAPSAEAVANYEKDPAFVRRANDAAVNGKAKSMLSLAQNYKAAGRNDLAKAKYQAVIDEFPNTSYAKIAKDEMADLK